MSRLGEKIAAENLEIGRAYNVKRKTGEATVEIIGLTNVGVEVGIKAGGFDTGLKKYKKGDILAVPYDSQWYEPGI